MELPRGADCSRGHSAEVEFPSVFRTRKSGRDLESNLKEVWDDFASVGSDQKFPLRSMSE